MGAWSRERVSHVVDVLLGYFVLMPLVVLFWHSTWNIFEPETMTPTFAWTEFALGMVIEVLLGFFQVPLRNYLLVHRSRSPLIYVVATRLYNYALGTVNILHYKGLADLYGLYTEEDSLMTALQTTATATVLLGSLRVTRNILGVPFFVDVDCNIDDYFQTTPYFSTVSDMSMFDLFDHATTIVLVHTLVHVHWIGVGVILESLLFPNDPSTAIIANMALGYVTCSALLASQDRLVATAQGLEAAGNRKLHVLFEDAVIVAANTASIFLWNGMWSIFDVTFVPDDTSYLLVQLATYALLVLAHATPNVIGKGCDIDGQAPNGDGITWCTDFVGAILAGHGASAEESDKDK